MRFPGGVADPVLGRAYVRDQAGTVTAVDLDTGRALWTRGPGLRPLDVVPGNAVVVARAGSARLDIATLDADGGDERLLATADLPGWAGPGPDLRLSGTVTGGRLRLRWAARRDYQGGAAPSEARLADHARQAGETIEVDLRNGEMTRAAAPRDDEPDSPVTATGASVLDTARVGPHRYELGASAGGTPVLRATDDRTGVIRWELPLGAGPTRGPRPLRP